MLEVEMGWRTKEGCGGVDVVLVVVGLVAEDKG
jgi:hypothetical protein